MEARWPYIRLRTADMREAIKPVQPGEEREVPVLLPDEDAMIDQVPAPDGPSRKSISCPTSCVSSMEQSV